MKVMAIGIYQLGGILYVFDIATFLKVIWQLNVEEIRDSSGFAFLFSVIGSEKSSYSLNQSDPKVKLITSWSSSFSRVLGCLFVCTLSFGS